MPFKPTPNPKCPKCGKDVFFAEKATALGKDWHKGCLKCGMWDNGASIMTLEGKCNKTLANGGFLEHEGTPYCEKPCYGALFGPSGYGRGGGVESHKDFGGGHSELQKK